MKKALSLSVLALFILPIMTSSCSDDDDAASSSPSSACDSMCKGAGFTSSRVESAPHETNCFCTGTGTVTAAACTDMCKSVSKPGKPFSSGGGATPNACQCQ